MQIKAHRCTDIGEYELEIEINGVWHYLSEADVIRLMAELNSFSERDTKPVHCSSCKSLMAPTSTIILCCPDCGNQSFQPKGSTE